MSRGRQKSIGSVLLCALVFGSLLGGCDAGSGPAAAPTVAASTIGPKPAAVRPPAGVQRISVRVGSSERSALLVRPTTSGSSRRPLLIFLHGARSDAETVRRALAIDGDARRQNVIEAFPEGDPVHHSWRSGCCSSEGDTSADFDFIATLIGDLVDRGEVSPTHVVLAGFSAGALFANSFACRHPRLVTAVVPVAGALLLPPAFARASSGAQRCSPPGPVTVLAVHGAQDTQIPVAGATSGCGVCLPGAGGFLASAQTVDGWWQRLDGCAGPVARRSNATVTTTLVRCRSGTRVGLAVVAGVGHDLAGLVAKFPLRATLLALATGHRLSTW